jgi:hypothetical protein
VREYQIALGPPSGSYDVGYLCAGNNTVIASDLAAFVLGGLRSGKYARQCPLSAIRTSISQGKKQWHFAV